MLNKDYIYYGFDYSKDAVNLASDYIDSNKYYFLADVNNIPLKNNSIDVIIDFLSPYNTNEIKRVLKRDGLFIKISPGINYLKEIRNSLGLNEYEKEIDVYNNLNKNFNNMEKINYKETFKMDKEDLNNLYNMTPVNKDNNNLCINEITIDLNIYIISKE